VLRIGGGFLARRDSRISAGCDFIFEHTHPRIPISLLDGLSTPVLARKVCEGAFGEPETNRLRLARQFRNYDFMNSSRSALIWSAFVVGMPCGNPGYDFSVPCFKSFTDFFPLLSKGQI
jgi:hypothetical protein